MNPLCESAYWSWAKQRLDGEALQVSGETQVDSGMSPWELLVFEGHLSMEEAMRPLEGSTLMLLCPSCGSFSDVPHLLVGFALDCVCPDCHKATPALAPGEEFESTIVHDASEAEPGTADSGTADTGTGDTLNVGREEARRIGPYSVRTMLGQGSSGSVYLVEDAEGVEAALKLVTNQDQRFAREIEILRRVQDPNLVAYLDEGVDSQGHPYLVMEYLPGGDLRRLVNLRANENLGVGEAVYVLLCCTRGLRALHAADVIHRDVKPSNLLATLDGRVILTDCGISLAGNVTERLTAQNKVLGTPQYVAPELLQGKDATSGSDVFSLGAMAWRLLTGQRPFPGKQVMEVLKARLTASPPPIDTACPDAPVWLVRLVERMLERDPAKRPPLDEVESLLSESKLLPTQVEMAARWKKELNELSFERDTVLEDTRVHVGDKFLHYRIESELGRGGMGVVYQAFHLGLRKRVAVKMLLQGALASERERQRFLREAEAVAGLEHPSIVPVLDAGVHKGTYYLVMDFVDGDTLSTWRVKKPREALLSALLEVCQGIHHAHTRGVIHRDLKPDNIMVDAAGHAHVLDFGIAKTGTDEGSGSLTQDGSVLGTLRYMAPEQARGATKEVDVRSDVYALGSVLYELLTGRTPFRGSLHELLHHVVHSEPAPPTHYVSDLPWELEAICLKALEKKREERYQSALEFSRDIERFLAGVPIRARRATLVYRTRKWISRNRLKSSLAAAALIGLSLTGWGINAGAERAEAERRAGIVAKLAEGLESYQAGNYELAARSFGIAAETLQTSDNFPLPSETAAQLPEAIRDALPEDERIQPRLGRARLERWSDHALAQAELQSTDALFKTATRTIEDGATSEALIQLRIVLATAPRDPRVTPLRERLAKRLLDQGLSALAKEAALAKEGKPLAERINALSGAEDVLGDAARLEHADADAALAVFHERRSALRLAEETYGARQQAGARLAKAREARKQATTATPKAARLALYAARRELTVARDRWSEIPGGREEQVRVALALGKLAIADGRVELARVELDNARLYEGILESEVKALAEEVATHDSRQREFLKQRKAAEGHFSAGRFARAADAYGLALAALVPGDSRTEGVKRRRTLATTYVSLERARRRADLDDERRLLQSAIQLADEPRDLRERLVTLDQELHQRELKRAHALARAARSGSGAWQEAIKAYEASLRYDRRSAEALRGRSDAFAERDCPVDMVLVSIPLRLLAKGSDAARVGELEVLRYYLDRHEVTNAAFASFLNEGGYTRGTWAAPAKVRATFVDSTGQLGPRGWSEGKPPAGAELLPVAGVSAFEAEAYAAARGRRLPTDREWLLAACFDPATGQFRRFPWGAELAPEELPPLRTLSAVGTRELDRSPWDIRDLGFNLTEWVRKSEDYAVRGLSTHYLGPDLVRGARDWSKAPLPAFRHPSLGFRCAASVPKPPALPSEPEQAERQK